MDINYLGEAIRILFPGLFVLGVGLYIASLIIRPNPKTHKIDYSESFINFANRHDFKTSLEIGDDVHTFVCSYRLPLMLFNVNSMLNYISNFCIGEYLKHPIYVYSYEGSINGLIFQRRFRVNYNRFTVIDLKLQNPKFEFADTTDSKIKYDEKTNLFTMRLPNKRDYTFEVLDGKLAELITENNVRVRVHNNSLVVFIEQMYLSMFFKPDQLFASKLEDLYIIATGILPYLEKTS